MVMSRWSTLSDVERVRVVARERATIAQRIAIGCAVGREALEEVLHVLVEQRVARELCRSVAGAASRSAAAVDEQVRCLDERRLLGQLLDRDAAVAEDPLVAVDEGDGALGRRRVHERRVERDVARSWRGAGRCRWRARPRCPTMTGASSLVSPSVMMALSVTGSSAATAFAHYRSKRPIAQRANRGISALSRHLFSRRSSACAMARRRCSCTSAA